MPLLVICNPICGAGDGYTFVQEHAIPLLKQAGKSIDKLVVTERAGHAGEIVAQVLKENSTQASEQVSIILSSGDGTLHEIVNAVATSVAGDLQRLAALSIALIPTGTANALYSSLFTTSRTEDAISYKLKAVKLLLNNSLCFPLTLAKTTIEGPSVTQTVISVVVTSLALHASILHDSEALRLSIPDLTRFKVAAAKNIKRWYNGTITLLPSPSGETLVYDHEEQFSGAVLPDACINGPFTYFLSVVNVDRLEPRFRIAPLQAPLSPSVSPTMDIVILRPREGDDHASAAKVTGNVLGQAYNDGAHVRLRADAGQGPTAAADDQITQPIVEYYRCGGWQWSPDGADEHSHLVCCDGTIFHIPQSGVATCEVLPSSMSKFTVYADS